jgi:hypothetical protein
MALGAQTAVAGGEPRDSVLPDLQLWGEKPDPGFPTEAKQKLGKTVKVNVGCGDEACTVSARGSVYWHVEDGGGKAAARLASHEFPYVKHDRLKPASAEFVGPGETTTLSLELKEKTRKEARKALNNRGKNAELNAEIAVDATDAAGNYKRWAAQGVIMLLKHHPRG